MLPLVSTMIETFLSFSWAFFVAMFAVPSIIYVAHLKNILDQPNRRTVHENLTPRLGGVAVFAGFMSALTIFADLDNGVQQVLAGCIILFFIGLKDDLVNISAFKKFIVQLLATGIVMFMADIRISSFQGVLGVYELPIGMSYAFTFLVIIGITNAINLIDGLDGLAGTIVLIIAATFGAYFFFYGGSAYGNYAQVALCLIGGLLGFLRYNFHKATIFMGDTGSLVCGFIVSILAIQFIEMQAVPAAPSVALGVLFVPLFDTIRVSLIRVMKGMSPFAPDKNHIHHRILAMGFKQISTVLILAMINILVIVFVLNFAHLGNLYLILSMLAFSVVVSGFLGVYRQRSAQSAT
ncbi:MAG: undecaprenyl/decaprenyl-phosphate alpha-N-acetylglucosaminyl 1-phosphate transferase [Hymenobacteraceae bacterium]|nr:undecaprenyl/decaprenyl-phosphate alpha-N-acetylglucosaminyl 1-phosphate transferase [Hymenobacteraceae bacterium]MDX5394686.1 undecaprenyl/decaprenyl-phosphate alpha-N-acetylglucosaminyl 1-phosphate transferase [Hymenobacteraceae bacterium]MDX5510717.1 undecaprenyl/decaprenyl-phosphate alpha-N-acetylglucosaminyl 1-phosphate transferase [Hymenobacteraceae bacterium]